MSGAYGAQERARLDACRARLEDAAEEDGVRWTGEG